MIFNKSIEQKVKGQTMIFPDDDEISGFYLDDGTKIDPNLIPKPSLCAACELDESLDPEDHVLCTLTRIDQMNEPDFHCAAFIEKKI